MADSSRSSHPLTVRTTSRPTRVAFLVDAADAAAAQINRLIEYCSCTWGGRYNPILPLEDSELHSGWWDLLCQVDPDVVVCVGVPSEGLVFRIERDICPAELILVNDEDRNRADGRHILSRMRAPSLGVEHLIGHVGRRSFPPEPTLVYIKTTEQDGAYRTFVLRNFGMLTAHVGMDNAFAGVNHEVTGPDPVSVDEVISHMASVRNPVLPLDLCSEAAFPRRIVRRSGFDRSFHVIVGDGVFDALLAWNRVHLVPLEERKNCIWLPSAALTDEVLLRATADWISSSYWPGDSPRRGTILSSSHSDDELADMRDLLQNLTTNMGFLAYSTGPGFVPVPETDSVLLDKARETDLVPMLVMASKKGTFAAG